MWAGAVPRRGDRRNTPPLPALTLLRGGGAADDRSPALARGLLHTGPAEPGLRSHRAGAGVAARSRPARRRAHDLVLEPGAAAESHAALASHVPADVLAVLRGVISGRGRPAVC